MDVFVTPPNPANIIKVTPPSGGNVVTVYAGIAGPQGQKGDKGDKGDTGATGATGPQGPKGDKGDPGASYNQDLNTTNNVQFAGIEINGLSTTQKLVVGNQLGGYVSSGAHKSQIVATGSQTPLMIEGGSGAIEIWSDPDPNSANSFGCAIPGQAISQDFVFARYNNIDGWVETLRIRNDAGEVFVSGTLYSNGQSVVTEAPSDGKQYARKDGAWEAITTGNPFDQSLNTTDDVAFNTASFSGSESSIAIGNESGYGVVSFGYPSRQPIRLVSQANCILVSNGQLKVDVEGSSFSVVLDNDSRLTDSRTPTAHKNSHSIGGSDRLYPSDIGAASVAQSVAFAIALS